MKLAMHLVRLVIVQRLLVHALGGSENLVYPIGLAVAAAIVWLHFESRRQRDLDAAALPAAMLVRRRDRSAS